MQVNDIIHGFKVLSIRPINEISGDMYEMVHLKTNAKTIWLKRNDENKTFCISFKTTPVDDTGVFHILEHCVLNGSDRYPVREPFVDLLKGSLQTFLNAMTFSDKTMYPVSSRNNKDFVNLMRVYLDAVFHPLAMKNPNIFRQEGWHYEITDANEQPIFNGVVYNEMKGAFSSSDSVKSRLMLHSLFPDTCYGNESGGDPVSIPNLTYQQFCDSHAKYYNPSNSFIVLDGDMDIETILGIIDDEYLSSYTDAGEKIVIDIQQAVEAEPVTQDYEIGPQEDPSGKAHISYGYVVGNYDDYTKVTALSLLSSVLCGTNSSPLKKAILEKGLGEDVNFDVEDGILQPYIQIDVENTDVEKEPEVTKTIMETLQQIITEGIDKEELEATLSRKEFYAKTKDFGGAPKGLVYAIDAVTPWLYGGDPVDGLESEKIFTQLREYLSTSYYEDLLQECILNSKHHGQVILKPSNTLGAQKAEIEAQKLAQAKESWSNEEIEQLIQMNKDLKKWQETEDTPAQQATLPKLHLEDLKKEATDLPVDICCHGGTNTVLKHNVDTNGVTYVTLYSDVKDLTIEQYAIVGLLNSLLKNMPTKNYTPVQLERKIKSLLGNFSVKVGGYQHYHGGEDKYLVDVNWSSLHRNDVAAIELVKEILYNTTFDDTNAIRDIVKQNKTAIAQNFIRSGNTYGLQRAQAAFSIPATISEYIAGYEAYKFYKNLDENWDSISGEVIQQVKELYAKLFTKQRLMISVNSEDKPTIVKGIIDTAPLGEEIIVSDKQPLGNGSEGIAIPSNVSYACKVGNVQVEDQNRGLMYVLSNILTFDYLWNEVRVKGGSYGCGFNSRKKYVATFHSFRDPNPKNSLAVYQNANNYLDGFINSDQDIVKYIVGSTGDFDPLLAPKAQISTSDYEYIVGYTYQDKQEILNQILAVNKEDIEKAKVIIDKINTDEHICVVGNGQSIEACKDQLQSIFNF